MSNLETEHLESPFKQAGTIRDSSLNQLREQIKKVMIPLLIKTFQLKLEHNQTLSLPSRLQNTKNQRSQEEIVDQLQQLDKDLKMLMLWCQSSRSQIQKALCAPEEEMKSTIATTSTDLANPAVSKSFSDAVSSRSSLFQSPPQHSENGEENPSAPLLRKKKWWWPLSKN